MDTSNCEWNESPTIPTEKEILSGIVIHVLFQRLFEGEHSLCIVCGKFIRLTYLKNLATSLGS